MNAGYWILCFFLLADAHQTLLQRSPVPCDEPTELKLPNGDCVSQGDSAVLGAAFTRGVGGQLINTKNKDLVLRSRLSAAAVVSEHSLVGTSSLSVTIIDQPTAFERLDNSMIKNQASCVILASVKVNGSTPRPMDISLYFSLLDEYKPHVEACYSCSFYDARARRWSESGCSRPIENRALHRYECHCNHLSTFALLWTPIFSTFCKNSTHYLALNGSCLSRNDTQVIVLNSLRNSTNSLVIVDALSSYFTALSNSSTPGNIDNSLTVDEIDELLTNLNNVNLVQNTAESILLVQQPDQGNGMIVLGASFNRAFGGQVVTTGNTYPALSVPISNAAVISPESLVDVISLNMLIIDKPTMFENLQNSSNKKLASSVVVADVRRNGFASRPIHISLYFQVLNEYRPSVDVDYFCSFYDSRINGWNESGCSKPVYNTVLDRYECSCDHLTSFALIWLPKTQETPYLTALDIASLTTQSFAILCFLIVLIHASVTRFTHASTRVSIYQLLPLLSTASSSMLFVFYIALGTTVYTRQADPAETRCFTSASVLLFFVYFFFICMFCVKTSMSYFSYLRYVSPSSKPPIRKLITMLIVSLFVSIAALSSAAVLDFTSSFQITQMYQGKICWFTRNVIRYFLTIPVCLFLLFTLILLIMFAVRLIQYHRTVQTSPRHYSYECLKGCVLVLLASCVTQGVAWVLDLALGYVAGWFFIMFNSLEGIWSISLYSIIRLQRRNELNPLQATSTPKEASSSTSNRPKAITVENVYHRSYIARTESERKSDSIQEDAVSDTTPGPN